MYKELVILAVLLPTACIAASERVDLEGLVLSVSDARCAQIFHIVDQLSLWDVYSHRQYSRWAEDTHLLDQADRELLKKHAELRKKRGWGNGFEQTFLVDDSIEHAAATGIAAGLLRADEANAERDILLHFAPKLEPLLQERQAAINAIQKQLVARRAELAPLVQQLAHFGEIKEPPTVAVFLVSNAEERDGGGGANGGRIVVEVPLRDPIGVLLHESLHQLLRPQEPAIKAAAEAAGMDSTLLKEGIAYALYPGVTADTEQGDRLVEDLVRMQLRGAPASDHFLQFNQLAAVIRPLLKAALAPNETISTFLPRATAKWRAVTTL
ncbi:MAG TPA: hypothetical protein VN736_00205 [Candidatus Limnocylindrales bacterium]|nr:hypothetical protein [Candidatus Limnocylindrales bacterium]